VDRCDEMGPVQFCVSVIFCSPRGPPPVADHRKRPLLRLYRLLHSVRSRSPPTVTKAAWSPHGCYAGAGRYADGRFRGVVEGYKVPPRASTCLTIPATSLVVCCCRPWRVPFLLVVGPCTVWDWLGHLPGNRHIHIKGAAYTCFFEGAGLIPDPCRSLFPSTTGPLWSKPNKGLRRWILLCLCIPVFLDPFTPHP